jgi:hypothetical protein
MVAAIIMLPALVCWLQRPDQKRAAAALEQD